MRIDLAVDCEGESPESLDIASLTSLLGGKLGRMIAKLIAGAEASRVAIQIELPGDDEYDDY
jgi:hypothetical protein